MDLDLLPSSLRKLELINIQVKQTGRLIKFKSLVEMKLRNIGLNDLPKNFVQQHLITLDVSNNNLKKLSNTMLQMSNLEQLDLSRNQLTTIDYLFDHLTSLKQLNLSSNLISRLTEFSFRNLTQLQYLNLKSNRLHQVELGAFYQLNNLVKLILDDNIRLEHLKLDLFALRMRSLHLSQTNLTSIPQSINEHIRELYLDHNQLERLTIGDFEHLTNLKTLHLNSNLLNEIEFDTFGRMSYLVELYLSSNHLLQVPEQLPKLLRILSLSDNLITELNCSKIMHLNQLETIDLSTNYIQHLDLHCFSTFLNLKYLDLSENQLTTVDELFVNLKQLETLNLSGNELIRLSDRSWLGLDNLKDLQLNNIKQQNLSCFNLDNRNYLFHHLPQLTLLNLTSSLYLSDCIFSYDQHLDKITKSNKFNIDPIVNYFPNLERLIVKELNLFNKLNLTRLQLNLPRLIELDILNSTLNCDNLNLKRLLNLINEDIKISIQLINLDRWICSSPKKVKNRLLIDLLIADQTSYHYRKLFLEYSNNLELKRLNKFDFNSLSSVQPKASAHQLINLKQHQIKWSKLMANEQYEEQSEQQIDFKTKNRTFSLFNSSHFHIINLVCWTIMVFLVFGLSHLVLYKLQIKSKLNNLYRSYHNQHTRFKHVNYSKQHDDVFIIAQSSSNNDGQSNSEEPLIS